MICQPDATSRLSIAVHSIVPDTGSLKTAASVFRCLRFIQASWLMLAENASAPPVASWSRLPFCPKASDRAEERSDCGVGVGSRNRFRRIVADAPGAAQEEQRHWREGRHRNGVVTGAAEERHGLEAFRLDGPGKLVAQPGCAGGAFRFVQYLRPRREGAALRAALDPFLQCGERFLAHRVVGRAKIDGEARGAGDHVDGAGKSLETADRSHEIRMASEIGRASWRES